jgi:oxygen-independent coproporphyrinogen-3 oxidase
MSSPNRTPPLSLYVHIPWCVRKCPYCDFNSHAINNSIPEHEYTNALMDDLRHELTRHASKPLTSIFFGGGTPSLFSATSIDKIVTLAKNLIGFEPDIEITLEANPGTTEHTDFEMLRAAGINRLSLGVQSFDDLQLKNLGRIHNQHDAISAFNKARIAGFDNINLDLMHGLPAQSEQDAMADLDQAIALMPEHLSWYQLTIEPNTIFYNSPPSLPNEDTLSEIQNNGEVKLRAAGFYQYEVSAYAANNNLAKHNLNYWQFGDYLAIGAGAHGKITNANGTVERYRKTRLPSDYLNPKKAKTAGRSIVEPHRLPLEFMMNALRLIEGVPNILFEARTGISLNVISEVLTSLQSDGLMERGNNLKATELGLRFLNTVLSRFDNVGIR